MTIYKSAAALSGLCPDMAMAGNVLNRLGVYTATEALLVGDVIQMVPVPKNAMILDIKGTVAGAAASTEIDVGDGDNPDHFIDGFTTGTGDGFIFNWVEDGDYAGMYRKYTTNDTIDITLKSALAAGATLKLDANYKMLGTLSDET
jgi:hypothetical protein